MDHKSGMSIGAVTSIRKLMSFELLLTNLFGGFIFEGVTFLKFNIILRCTSPILAMLGDRLMFKRFYNVLAMMDPRTGQNIKIFSVLGMVANTIGRVVDLYSQIATYKIVYVLLDKRFERAQLTAGSYRVPRFELARRMYIVAFIMHFIFTYMRELCYIVADLSNDAALCVNQAQAHLGSAARNISANTQLTPFVIHHAPINNQADCQMLAERNTLQILGWLIENEPGSFWLLSALSTAPLMLLEMVQFHGSTLITFYVAAVATDLMHGALGHVRRRKIQLYTCVEDDRDFCLLVRNRHNDNNNNNTGIIKTNSMNNPDGVNFLRQTLEHVRELLIVTRETQAMSWLVLWLRSIIHFCLLSLVYFASFEYELNFFAFMTLIGIIRRLFSMSILLLGYYWLHQEAELIRRAADTLILETKYEVDDAQLTNMSESNATRTAELVTVRRLVEDIQTMWPTDWLRPDFQSFASANILTIVLVTTMQQLVEAAGQMNLRD